MGILTSVVQLQKQISILIFIYPNIQLQFSFIHYSQPVLVGYPHIQLQFSFIQPYSQPVLVGHPHIQVQFSFIQPYSQPVLVGHPTFNFSLVLFNHIHNQFW